MIVATINITTGRLSFSHEHNHGISFDDLEKAKSEYARVVDFLQKRGNRENDLPKTIEIDGASGTKLTVGLDDIVTISLVDFVLANEMEKGTRDSFPMLFPLKR